MFKRGIALFGSFLLAAGLLVGCGQSDETERGGKGLSGTVKIDGSSTVYPISQAVAEEFMLTNPRVRVTVSESGTGGGFQKWVVGETDINNASRPIKEDEKKKAAENGIEPIEIPVAFDGVTVVVNKNNNFVEELTVEELKKIWEPGSKVKYWSDVRPEWPKEPIKLYGPGTASGTFGYFTEAVIGKEGKSRTDYTASEDDNVLVQGISGDQYSLGYFGYAYYEENKDQLKAVKIDGGDGPVEPNEQTINDGTYPLSRPVFIYVSSKAAERPEVKDFVKFYIEIAKDLTREVGFIPLPDADYEKSLKQLEEK